MTPSDRPVGEDDLQAYVDGRLAPDRLAAVEAHLDANPERARFVARDRELRDLMRAALAAKAAEPVPAALRVDTIAAEIARDRRPRLRMAAAAVVLFALGATSGWLARGLPGETAREGSAVADALRAHGTFVVEVAHPVEVGAGEAAHLSKWLSNRLGHPVALPDLSGDGYQLLGGRLLPSVSGPAGQIMYQDGAGRRLTVYLRPDGGIASEFRFAESAEGSAFYWTDASLTYAVVAKAPRPVLFEAATSVFRSMHGDEAGR